MTPPAAVASPRARVAAPPRPRVSPSRPRRVSGPVRQPARKSAPAAAPPLREERGLALVVLDALAGVTRNGALDRLIRGRIWIAVIAFALIGIVTLQLLVLQLNASIGRALVREGQLQHENAALSIEGSELAAGERVESRAALLGMQLVPVGSLRFLRSDPQADIARAAAALNTPVHSAGSSSGETATATSAASATTASTAGSEQAPSEASTPASGEAAASASAAEAGASAATPSTASMSTGAAAPVTAATTPTTGANAPSEAATASVVGGAGGVGATQTNGAG